MNRSGAVCLGLLVLLTTTTLAQAEFVPVYLPQLEIARSHGEISIDANLDDPGWRAAARAGNFAEHSPGDQIEPPVDTQVLITYDDDALYVAFICQDDPDLVRASFCERDRINSDDNVILLLDTFGDGVNAYEFGVNPYGIQADWLYASGSGEDSSRDFIYESAGRMTETGWQVEMAIPFSSLRFPNTEPQTWKMDFWRNHPRQVRGQYSWAAFDRDDSCWPCQWGTVTGISGVDSGNGLDLIPAFVATQSGWRKDDGEFENGKTNGEGSLNAKYSVSSDLTAEVTVNPDFSQIESDQARIDVNTKYALFYPEKRPFFQEGAELYNTWFNAVYTRSINDPFVAGKVTGRSGNTSYSLLSAYDENSPVILPFEEKTAFADVGKSWSNIARFKQELSEQTFVGLVATDRRYDIGGRGSLISLDSRVRLNQIYQLEAQLLTSFSSEPNDTTLTSGINDETFDDGRYTSGFDGESFNGHGVYASFERMGRHWFFDFDYWDSSPTFRADSGFETSNSTRVGAFTTEYEFRFDDSELLESITPSTRLTRTWNYQDVVKDEKATIDLTLRLRKAQTRIHLATNTGAEQYGGVDFNRVWSHHGCFSLQPSDLIAVGGSANYGHGVQYRTLELGRQSSYSGWFDLKPVDRLLLAFQLEYSQSRAMDTDTLFYAGYVGRSTLNLQLTRELSTRVIVQYDSFDQIWEADPLITYQINPFSAFYLGSTRDYRLLNEKQDGPKRWRLADRQYFLKIQYLFQL